MGKPRSNWVIGRRRGIVAIMLTLCLGCLGSTTVIAAPEQIDCAQSNLQVPGRQGPCTREVSAPRAGANCNYITYALAWDAQHSTPRQHFYLYQDTRHRCWLGWQYSEPDKLMHVAPYVEKQATNWGQLQKLDDGSTIMIFDSTDQKRDGKCFSFFKPGPPRSTGLSYWIRGYICKAPGEPLDAAGASAILKSIQVKD